MDTGIPKLLESHFGPESDLINISEFLQSAQDRKNASIQALEKQYAAVSEDRRVTLATECSVRDMKSVLEQTWNNPTLSSFLFKEHDRMAAALILGRDKPGRPVRRTHFPPPDMLPPEVRELHENLNNIKLSSWTLPLNSGTFIRTSRNSDQNAYDVLRFNELGSGATVQNEGEAIVIATVLDKVPWSPCYVSRLSRHAFLSSQTLQDVRRAIPCTPYATGVASDSNSPVQNYGIEDDRESGCIICIEGLAYGDGGDDDYAQKLMDHLGMASKSKTSIQKAPKTLSETTISSLSLRISEPYWMLHRGNCEHFIVVEQIRLLHPFDPHSGYPITLQQTPQMLDICRACGKSPAVWSIVNDIRLGESPSFLCAACWANMGVPDDSERDTIEIIPLLAYVP